MQSTRFIAANMLRSQPVTSSLLRQRAVPMLRMQPTRGFQTSLRRMATPKEEQAAHTVSQRLRQLRKIPVELIPIGVVLAAAIMAAVYSLGRKLVVDKTLRLSRTGKQAQSDH